MPLDQRGRGQGPTWKGLYKRDVEFSKSNVPGYTLKASDDDAKWDAYLRESILHPEAKIVQGFQNNMPPQESALERIAEQREEAGGHHRVHQERGNPKYYKPMKTPELPGGEKRKPRRRAKRDKAEKPEKPQRS